MIVCVAVVGHQNNPLYIQSFTEADDALKLHHIVHCSLDVVDERGYIAKPGGRGRRRSRPELIVHYVQTLQPKIMLKEVHPLQFRVNAELDIVDWKKMMNNPKKSGPTLNDTFLGLLYPTENYKVYGYLTNTKVKFMVVTTDLDVRDTDVRNFFRRFHAAYVDAVSNPFHVPGKKITSKTFAERVSGIVKSFGMSSAA